MVWQKEWRLYLQELNVKILSFNWHYKQYIMTGFVLIISKTYNCINKLSLRFSQVPNLQFTISIYHLPQFTALLCWNHLKGKFLEFADVLYTLWWIVNPSKLQYDYVIFSFFSVGLTVQNFSITLILWGFIFYKHLSSLKFYFSLCSTRTSWFLEAAEKFKESGIPKL